MVDPVCNDLATKAELQELRDQLNKVLGEKEDGTTEQIFAAGIDPLSAGALIGGTTLGLTKTRAANAIVDITYENPAFEPIWKDFANGKAKWARVKGNGTRQPLPDLSKIGEVAGKGAGGGAGAGKTAVGLTNSMGVLIGLVNIAATLALNIATVKILDKRIDAEARGAQQQLDAINSGMLRLYEKNQGNINAVQQQISQNEVITEQNRNEINRARADIQQAQDTNIQLRFQLEDAEQSISQLQAENQDLAQKIIEYNADYEEVTQDLTESIQRVDSQLETAKQTVNSQQLQIEEVEKEIELVNAKIDDLDGRVTVLEQESAALREDFELLRADLEGDLELVEARSKLNQAKLIILESRNQKAGRGGSPVSLTQNVADIQNNTLDLSNKLSSEQVDLQRIYREDIYNSSDYFNNTFEFLLEKINPSEVNQEQIDLLEENLKTDWRDTLSTLLQLEVVSKLNDISSQTTEEKQVSATEKGICNSLNSPTCAIDPTDPNQTNGLKGLLDKVGDKFGALNTALGLGALGQNQTILQIVKSTNDTVKNAQHGLEAVQNFAKKAWEATGADKVLNAITTAVVIHNGVQLSTNLAATIGETASVILDAVGIQDANNNPIDVNGVIKAKLNAFLSAMIGEGNYAALTTRLAKYNRVYQAGANLFDATRDLFDSARSTAELTAENTGKIGNALLEAGVVYENAYDEMVDSVNPQSRAMQRLDRFRDGLETIEDTVSTVGNIAQEVVSTKDSFTELKNAKEEWEQVNDTLLQEKQTTTEEIKLQSTVTATIEPIDFDVADGDSTTTP